MQVGKDCSLCYLHTYLLLAAVNLQFRWGHLHAQSVMVNVSTRI